MSIPSIILQNIEKYFNESSADSNKSFLKGYENVYLYITLKKSFNADIQIIVDLFTKAVYKKAKKYNNLDVYDKTKYNLETARMVRMCLYMERYIVNNTEKQFKHIKTKNIHVVAVYALLPLIKLDISDQLNINNI